MPPIRHSTLAKAGEPIRLKRIMHSPIQSGCASRRPLFCIVDPCLVDFVGHHFEYDRSTAVAAAKLGYQPLILSHAKVAAAIASGAGAIPTFSMTIWDSDPRFQDSPSENLQFCNQVFF